MTTRQRRLTSTILLQGSCHTFDGNIAKMMPARVANNHCTRNSPGQFLLLVFLAPQFTVEKLNIRFRFIAAFYRTISNCSLVRARSYIGEKVSIYNVTLLRRQSLAGFSRLPDYAW